jgi:hypothetical protein
MVSTRWDTTPFWITLQVRQYLDVIFQDKWKGRRGAIEWSLDLTPLDFFLWGHLKNRVYVNRPLDTEELKQRITNEIANISPNTLIALLQNFVQRIHQCQEVNGSILNIFYKIKILYFLYRLSFIVKSYKCSVLMKRSLCDTVLN